MNSNIAIQSTGTVAWDGANSRPADIRGHTVFAWSFEVTVDIAVDAVFNVEAADPSAADDCVPDAFAPVPEVSICASPAVPGPQATITIPAGTVAGSICAGTIPCRPGAFVRLTNGGGDVANVSAVLIRHGPTGAGVPNDPRDGGGFG